MKSEVTSEPICYMRHIRAAKLCSGGARGWFARNDLDWTDFLTNGVPGEKLLATGDPMALRTVEQARIERGG